MRAASLHDLHRETGIPKSTLIRILHTLAGRGLVWQRMADGAFVPSHLLQRRAPVDDAGWLGVGASPPLAAGRGRGARPPPRAAAPPHYSAGSGDNHAPPLCPAPAPR